MQGETPIEGLDGCWMHYPSPAACDRMIPTLHGASHPPVELARSSPRMERRSALVRSSPTSDDGATCS